MSDKLIYRLPDSEIIQSSGVFRRTASFDEELGFVVSAYDSNDKYVFLISDTLQSGFHDSKNVPYIEDENSYLENATEFKNELVNRNLSKAVYSRVKSVDLEIDVEAFFNRLCKEYPKAFVYLISSPLFGTWIGASPEVLVEYVDTKVQTMALAGTLPSDTSELWEEKELNEQQYVSDFILENINKVKGTNLIVQDRQEITAGPVKHLRTKFTFDLNQTSLLNFIDLMHPTPAVSGLPQGDAISLIEKCENHNRGLYTGFLGVKNDKSTRLFVNLRCGQVIGSKLYLYLGGGFTKDSIIEKEWKETENKAKTLLDVLENK